MKLSNKPILVLSTIISIAAASCTKDKQTSTSVNKFPKTFEYQGTDVSPTTVFTAKGEVTDPDLKAKAIVSTGLAQLSNPASRPQADITFTSAKKLQVETDHFSSKNDDGTQAFFNDKHSEISTDGDDDLRAKFSPFYKLLNISHEGNKDFYAGSIVIKTDNSTAKVSALDICWIHRDPVTNKVIKTYAMSSSNEFNLVLAKNTLDKNDTIAVREYTSNYVLKK
jgi:hypothetical protein